MDGAPRARAPPPPAGGGRSAPRGPSEFAIDWALVVIAFVALAAFDRARPHEGAAARRGTAPRRAAPRRAAAAPPARQTGPPTRPLTGPPRRAAGYIPKALLSGTSYPLRPNSVPAWSVPVLALLAPLAVLLAHGAALRRPRAEAHHLALGLSVAVMVAGAVTNAIKCPVGRLRPDFNARCWPDGVIAWAREDGFGGWAKCSGAPSVVAEGRKSFPSGHSSWSAAGLCYLTWFLIDRLGALSAAGGGHPWRLVAALLPSAGAVAVGVSRVHDAWHHPSDVAVGLALGAGLSWLCYRQQRARLAELDPITYGGTLGSGGGAAARPPGEDGVPLLGAGEQRLPV
ncbi:LPP3 [Scenedesmus sp. PABB004]|nr:LPP3 [Scenedesmus sp. PABB004]